MPTRAVNSKLLVAFDIAWKIRNKIYRDYLLDQDLVFKFTQDFSRTKMNEEFFCLDGFDKENNEL